MFTRIPLDYAGIELSVNSFRSANLVFIELDTSC